MCRRIDEQPPDMDGEAGERVLVDRVWPEGMRRQVAPFDEWLREVTPSAEPLAPAAHGCRPRSSPGRSVVLWAFSSWLIPLLLALGVWRHALRRVPLRYELGWWNLVFPVGMYAVTTHELGRATGTPWLTSAGRWEVRIAAVFWAVVFAATILARLRARPTATHGSAGAGRTARPRSTAPAAPGAPP
ncbi:SLAC1 family transporter [Streptomyces sp. 900105755]